MIQFIRVGRAVRGRLVPARASFEVKPGELVRVAGPSGSGQSLLVRMALGTVAPTTGTVMVNGVNPFRLPAAGRQRVRRLLGPVLDDEPPLALAVDAWVALGGWCAGRPWDAALAAAREGLARAGLEVLAGERVTGLRRGDRFAAALVRALLRRPHAVLIDWRDADAGPPPAALQDELDAYLTGGGAVLMTGESPEGAWPVPTRVERLKVDADAHGPDQPESPLPEPEAPRPAEEGA